MQEIRKPGRKPTRAAPRGGRTQPLLRALRTRILSLELPPGADVEEAALVREFGLSRTPVREALIQLAADGLIQLVPNRGARVAALDLGQVPQMLEALELYQRATTRWAALRRRPEHLDALVRMSHDFAHAAEAKDLVGMAETNRLFHGVVADACGNTFLAADCRAMESRTVRLARAAFGSAHDIADRDEYFNGAVEQHAAILDAIRSGDAERADRLATAHCAVFRRRIADFVAASAAGEINLGPRDPTGRETSGQSLAFS
jgi:DNA-binding GntR family transcriptional regulator